jgi:drug/metabolite transporter (DMT)-like permease
MPTSLNARGALLMTLSVLAFVLNDGLMKTLLVDMSIYQAVFLRGIITIPFMAIMAWRTGVLIVKLKGRDKKIILGRVLTEVLATISFLTALRHMPLANITAILQALPLTVTMAAALFLNEPVGWRRWIAILIGLCGVLVIIRPGMEGFSSYSLWALGAVVCVTFREIVTRQLSKDVPSLPVALATAIVICGFGAVNLPGVSWVPVSPALWVYLGGAGIAIIGGYLFSVMAVRVGDISFVSPFRYTAMIWAITLGFLLFGDLPDLPTIIGTLIIVLAGLYSLHRERKRASLC